MKPKRSGGSSFSVKPLQESASLGKLGGWLSIAVNSVLFLVKGGIALWTGSIALAADAFHTLSDMATSLIVLISIRYSDRPGDWQHPFGHQRAVHVATIVMSTLLVVTAVELGKEAVKHSFQASVVEVPWVVIIVIFLTVVVKEILARVTLHLSQKAQLSILSVDAWHHRSDAISSGAVLVSLVASHYGVFWIDGVVGFVISLFIVYVAFRLARDSFNEILGTRPDEALLQEIETIASSVDKVLGVHDIVIHTYGKQRLVSLHIEVDENLSLVEAHQISEEVDRRLRNKLGVYSTVHVDPVMQRTQRYVEVEKGVQHLCKELSNCHGFHDLRIIEKNDKVHIHVDFVLNTNPETIDLSSLRQTISRKITEKFPWVHEVVVKFEPVFAVSRRSRHDLRFGE